jgi:CHRD domain
MTVRSLRTLVAVALAILVTLPLAGCGGDDDDGETLRADLSGENEVPPVSGTTGARMTFEVKENATVIEYSVKVAVPALADFLGAHIHLGDPGVNGPIIFAFKAPTGTQTPFELKGQLTATDLIPNPAGGISSLSDALAAIRAGKTYANVHSKAHPGGEIRGQIQPD